METFSRRTFLIGSLGALILPMNHRLNHQRKPRPSAGFGRAAFGVAPFGA
jgi:hypothetical protein